MPPREFVETIVSMAALTGHMLYFAYGDDLRHAVLKRACPGAEWFGPARLEDHRLTAAGGGRANAVAAPGEVVWGALWLVPGAEMANLETVAGAGYERTTRRIVSPAGPRTEATVYLSGKSSGAEVLANVAELIEGAKENRLPAAYIEELKRSGKSRKDSR